ncbi:MAG: LD-carboxypeptidase [Chakrabartia sp.]
MRIGIVAPSCTLDPTIPARLGALIADHFASQAPAIIFHPQCFLSEGHFAGPDDARAQAIIEYANDPDLDAIWFARGGYGACRIATTVLGKLGPSAREKLYLGYSDAGFLLAGLYAKSIGRVAHGPMPADIHRTGGEVAVLRALGWMINPEASKGAKGSDQPPVQVSAGRSKLAAFNLTVLSQLLGTPLEPDLTDHILIIEEVAEYMYRIDRSLFHITNNPNIRKVAGIKLGRCSQIPDNDPDFILDEKQIVEHWCQTASIPYLGRADIGHDIDNKIVAFG